MSTIKDVARLAGVSISTVSKYLNGGNVRPENAEPIRSAIAQLDYRANPYARALKVNRSRSIGILLPSITAPFFGNIVMTMDKRLREHGYHILLSCYDSDHGLERDYLSYLLTTGVDGLIYVPEDLSADEFYELTAQRPIPIIQVDRSIQGVQTDAVLTDNVDAVHRVVCRLLEKGHRRIAIITGPKSVFTSKERLVGYLRALSDHDVPYDDNMVVNGELTFATGYQSFISLMDLPHPPTAVFCSNHDITMGCITAARERAFQIPDQIDIFGYDSLESCSIMTPPIPVVRQPEDEIARIAASYLIDRLNGYDGPIRQTRLKSRLVF